ncbi:EAL domain-containing protein [Massilia glaciei]|nr:EAL domain-containing protein [Massilia glaciei]
MENLSSIRHPGASAAPDARIAATLIVPLCRLRVPDPAEDMVAFGRWWCDARSGQLVLSPTAARFFGVEAGWHASGAACCARLAAGDRNALFAAMAHGAPANCEVSVTSERGALRSLRIVKLPATGPDMADAGLLIDITQAKYAAVRERLSFESTQLLVGTGSVAEAVTRIIELVCLHLGWEWGAYCAMEGANFASPKLVCKQSWHDPHIALEAFSQDSLKRRMAPGEGLVGAVWRTGCAQWIEDLRNEASFVRSESAAACALRAGYAFPVSFVLADGRRRSLEIVRPDVFIPIAEQSRFIVQLGRWVIETACRDLALLQRSGFERLQLNVNMAAPEFIDACLPDQLRALVNACGIAPGHLCLELTEGMVMTHADKVIPIMLALRLHGFKISLDDFGMGYSSLSRLKELPISSLKIDGSFVRGLPHDPGDCAIVRSIIDLGRHMHLQIIAEGVETDALMLYLRNFGCNLIQGFLLRG